MLNTRHSVRSVPGRSVVVYEVARGFSGGQEFATSINVANEGSVTGVTELGVQHAYCDCFGLLRPQLLHIAAGSESSSGDSERSFLRSSFCKGSTSLPSA